MCVGLRLNYCGAGDRANVLTNSGKINQKGPSSMPPPESATMSSGVISSQFLSNMFLLAAVYDQDHLVAS